MGPKGKFSPFSFLSPSFVSFLFSSHRIMTSVSPVTTFSSPTIPASGYPPKTFGEHIYLPGIKREVQNCKVVESYYCIWFEKGFLKVENVGFNRIMQASKSQLCQFINAILELIQRPERSFFCKHDQFENGTTKLSKFKATEKDN